MARDAAKELCKKDRSRYLPLLIHANHQLAIELIGKGLLNDAKPVLEHMRTYAPAEIMAGLDALFNSDLATKSATSAPTPKAAPEREIFVTGLCELARIAEKIKGGAQPASPEIHFADEFALRFEALPEDIDDPSLQSLIREIKALSSAIEAAGAWNWDALTEALRGISALSPLRHWKLYFRGYRLWFDHQPLEARKIFERLPKGSAAELAARMLVNPETSSPLSMRTRAAWHLALAGAEKPDAETLVAAESEWKRGRWPQTVHTLRRAFGNTFFAPGNDFRSAVADAVFNISCVSSNLSKLVGSASANYRRMMDIYESQEGFCARFSRMLCLSDPLEARLDNILHEWKDAVPRLVEFYRGNALLVSQANLWLGNILSQRSVEPQQRSMLEIMLARMSGEGPADDTEIRFEWKKALQKATESDPGNEDAWRALLHFYERVKVTSKRNKLLNDIVERFPKNKEFLVKAGELALQRKALTKAEKYLALARQLDPLDPDLSKLDSKMLFANMLKAFAKGAPIDEFVKRIEASADPTPGLTDPEKALWMVRLRIEMALDRNPQSICAEAPSTPAFCVARAILRRKYPRSEKSMQSLPDISSMLKATGAELLPAAELLARSWESQEFKKYVIDGTGAFCRLLHNAFPPCEGTDDVKAYLKICADFCLMFPSMDFSEKVSIIEPVFQTLSWRIKKWPKSLIKNYPELEILRFGFRWVHGGFNHPQRQKIRKLKALAEDTQNPVLRFIVNHLFAVGQIDEPIGGEFGGRNPDFSPFEDFEIAPAQDSFSEPEVAPPRAPRTPARPKSPKQPPPPPANNESQLDLPF